MKYRLALPILLVLIVLAVVMIALQNDGDDSGLAGNTDQSPNGTNSNPDISTNLIHDDFDGNQADEKPDSVQCVDDKGNIISSAEAYIVQDYPNAVLLDTRFWWTDIAPEGASVIFIAKGHLSILISAKAGLKDKIKEVKLPRLFSAIVGPENGMNVRIAGIEIACVVPLDTVLAGNLIRPVEYFSGKLHPVSTDGSTTKETDRAGTVVF